MTHALHPEFSDTFVKHQDSMMVSLAHRIEVARAANDRRLIELLERERQQINVSTAGSSAVLNRRLKAIATPLQGGLIQRLRHWFARRSELQVSQFVNGSDQWWYAYDPQTGNFVYADSEAELSLWIKDNYRGR